MKGFTDSRNYFFVYDKQKDRILPDALTPDTFFFENNLNTVILPDGTSSDFLEDFYTDIENQFWGPLDTIRNSNSKTTIQLFDFRNSNSKTTIQLFDLMHLFLFLSFLHWRLPSNIKYVEELSKDFFVSDYKNLSYFTIKNKNGKTAPKEIIDKIKKSPAFKKTSRLIIPFASFYDSRWSERLKNWRFLYTADENIWHLVGDNPIITKGDSDHDPVNYLKEFVFPVSGKILLVNIGKPISKDFPPELVLQFNISIIERAQRFVACQNKDFLEAMIKFYKLHIRFKKTDMIIPEMFEMLEN